ncbi:MAG: tetratricopeptide repeat protein, partial [Gemmatimonadales bacterium]
MSAAARVRRIPALALTAALLAGCAYYNGMYNTNRLVRSAQKAERENRPFEASNLWGQVITRAESVSVRHPHSKYAAQATVLRGLAMSRLNQCPQAIVPLGQVELLPPGDLAEEATLALGQCQIETGDPASADLAFTRLVDSKDEFVKYQARFQHGRALRMTGHYDEAIPLLQESKEPRVADELLLALSGAGRDEEADSLAGVMLAGGDSTRVWDSLVVVMSRQRPGSAEAVLDRLSAQEGSAPFLTSRRLYEEGVRLGAVDTARAAARLRQAVEMGAGTEGGERARLRLFRLDVSRADGVAALASLSDSLRVFAGNATVINLDAMMLEATIGRVQFAADSGGAAIPEGDLRLFLAAESARDTLAAPRVAGELFRRIVTEWPESPYAPKALLAGERLDSTWADSAQMLLAERYSDSPYLAVVRGEAPDGYRILEDSLLAFAAAQPVTRPPPGVRARPGAPGAGRAPA